MAPFAASSCVPGASQRGSSSASPNTKSIPSLAHELHDVLAGGTGSSRDQYGLTALLHLTGLLQRDRRRHGAVELATGPGRQSPRPPPRTRRAHQVALQQEIRRKQGCCESSIRTRDGGPERANALVKTMASPTFKFSTPASTSHDAD